MDKKVIKNYLYNLIYQILIIITPLFTSPYISRVLHSDGVGIYSYTSSIAMTFSLFAALGVNSYGQREIAASREDATKCSLVFWELTILRFFTTVVVSVVYLYVCAVSKEYSIYLLQNYFIIAAVMFDISWYYQGLEDFKVVVIRNILVRLAAIACIFLLVKDESDVGLYILINAVSAFASNLFFLFRLNQTLVPVKWHEINLMRHCKGVIQFFIPLVAVQIYSQVDKIMLGSIAGSDTENGFYEQARKITNLVVVLITSLNTVLFSRMSHLFAHQRKDEMVDTYKESFRITLLLLVPISVGLFLIADEFAVWFFGAEFAKVAVLIKLSCPLVVFMCVGNFVGMQYLGPTGGQNKMTAIYVIAACLNVVLNFLMIPKLLSIGAMIASVAAEACSCFLQVWLMKRSEYNFKMLQGAWKYGLAAAAMAGAIWLFNAQVPVSGMVETLADILLGAASYFAVLLLLKEESLIGLAGKLLAKIKK